MLGTHRHPCISDDAVDPFDRLFRVARETYLAAIPLRPVDELLARFAAFRHRDVQVEAEARGGFQQRMQHVVAVAAPGEGLARHRPAMFLEGHYVGHELAGMGVVGQAVDDRDRRVLGQFEQPVVRGGADHDGVDIARQHLGRVGDGLGAAELHLRAGQHDGLAAELAHADVERHARARRRLVEDHRQHLALQRARALAGLEAGLARRRVVEDRPEIGFGDGGKIGEMAQRHRESPVTSPRQERPRPDAWRRRGCAPVLRGYRRR